MDSIITRFAEFYISKIADPINKGRMILTSSLNINVLKDEILQNYYDVRDIIFECLIEYREAKHKFSSKRATFIPDIFHKYKILLLPIGMYARTRPIPISDNIYKFLCELLREDLRIILYPYFIPELNKIIVEYSIYKKLTIYFPYSIIMHSITKWNLLSKLLQDLQNIMSPEHIL